MSHDTDNEHGMIDEGDTADELMDHGDEDAAAAEHAHQDEERKKKDKRLKAVLFGGLGVVAVGYFGYKLANGPVAPRPTMAPMSVQNQMPQQGAAPGSIGVNGVAPGMGAAPGVGVAANGASIGQQPGNVTGAQPLGAPADTAPGMPAAAAPGMPAAAAPGMPAAAAPGMPAAAAPGMPAAAAPGMPAAAAPGMPAAAVAGGSPSALTGAAPAQAADAATAAPSAVPADQAAQQAQPATAQAADVKAPEGFARGFDELTKKLDELKTMFTKFDDLNIGDRLSKLESRVGALESGGRPVAAATGSAAPVRHRHISHPVQKVLPLGEGEDLLFNRVVERVPAESDHVAPAPSHAARAAEAVRGYSLHAVIPGRIWIKGMDGNSQTFENGETLPDGAKILKIDPDRGDVVTSKGVLKFDSQ